MTLSLWINIAIFVFLLSTFKFMMRAPTVKEIQAYADVEIAYIQSLTMLTKTERQKLRIEVMKDAGYSDQAKRIVKVLDRLDKDDKDDLGKGER